ncbi:hypothetical protein [Jeotgalibaca dankookensis]|uniref:hypothetical protein n=1 Tax=Jeotgalibaca dankookensis TaxID=708126 RepID=UPI000785207F|nr:hypothetical protein [Jeotgalibaca dankookensis]
MSLRKFNGVMGVLHLIQGLLMLGVALFFDKIASLGIPIFSYFLNLVAKSVLAWIAFAGVMQPA